MHNQPREPQPYEDCQAKSIQETKVLESGGRVEKLIAQVA